MKYKSIYAAFAASAYFAQGAKASVTKNYVVVAENNDFTINSAILGHGDTVLDTPHNFYISASLTSDEVENLKYNSPNIIIEEDKEINLYDELKLIDAVYVDGKLVKRDINNEVHKKLSTVPAVESQGVLYEYATDEELYPEDPNDNLESDDSLEAIDTIPQCKTKLKNRLNYFVVDTRLYYSDRQLSDLELIVGGDYMGNESCHTHGSNVAQIIAGRNIGVLSQQSNIRMIGINAFSCSGKSSISTLIKALSEVVKKSKELDGNSILNASFGGGASNALDKAMEDVAAANILPVVAAGNFGRPACSLFSPARAKHTLTVGGTDKTGESVSFSSNFGTGTDNDCVEIYAPFTVKVPKINYPEDASYASISGTSFSTPIIAGLAGLRWDSAPHKTASDIMQDIRDELVDITVNRYNFKGNIYVMPKDQACNYVESRVLPKKVTVDVDDYTHWYPLPESNFCLTFSLKDSSKGDPLYIGLRNEESTEPDVEVMLNDKIRKRWYESSVTENDEEVSSKHSRINVIGKRKGLKGKLVVKADESHGDNLTYYRLRGKRQLPVISADIETNVSEIAFKSDDSDLEIINIKPCNPR